MLRFPTLARPAPAAIASVCVFGGAHDGRDGCLAAATAALGRCIGHAGLRLVYGGGGDGLMACAARAACAHGGEIVAIAPRFFTERPGWSSPYGTEIVVPDMATRKRLMFDHADAFIALPGGIGTIEELAEVMTLAKLGQHAKPIVLANFGGFWTPWLDFLAHLAAAGFTDVSEGCAVVEDPEVILDELGHRVPIAADPIPIRGCR